MRAFLRALVISISTGAVLAAIGLATAGASAATGALVGAGLVVVVFGAGAVVVDYASWVAPAASLLVALTTYTLQATALGAAFYLVNRGVLGAATGDRQWISAGVMVSLIAWLAVHVTTLTRQRIPVFAVGSDSPVRGVRSGGTGGEA